MNVNKVHLVGRVGGDPKIGETSRGDTMATVSLATNSGYGDNEKTDWHRVKFFGKIADTVNEYVKKGQELYVEGRISYSKYTDKQTGVEKYSTEIVAHSMQMGKKSNTEVSSSVSSSTSESIEDDSIPFQEWGGESPPIFPLSSKDKKATPVPESKGKVPYRFIICKVKGCVTMHDDFYPMCNKHRNEIKK